MRKYNGVKKFGDRPKEDFFKELFRISKNQVIWGANNFNLPPCKGFFIWEKTNIPENFTMSMAEYAWISEGLGTISKIFKYSSSSQKRIHPTQKPIELYTWIFNNCAKQGDKILDTHLGSGSSRIASYKAGLEFVGCEIDKFYFEAQEKRFKEFTSQISLFDKA